MTADDLTPIIERLDEIADNAALSWQLLACIILVMGIIFGGIMIKTILERFRK